MAIAAATIEAVSLRTYQSAAFAAALASHRSGQHPVVSLPTGSGKSLVVGKIAFELRDSGPIVITVPSRELAIQNERAAQAFLPAHDIGVACAALGRREYDRPVLIGTPQSLAGAISVDPACVIVDEAHQMPLHHGSWFARLFDALPRKRATPRIGLSATTFRTADGAIYGGPKSWFSCQPYAIAVNELVAQGYLAPVRYVDPGAGVMSTRGVSRSAGDFNQNELARANMDRVEDQVAEVLKALRKRKKAMVFAVTVEHAETFQLEFKAQGEPAVLIVGAMSTRDRDEAVRAFKSGEARVAVTVSAALTGFDVPDIDLLACCRPTMSPIIHTQSIGRGTRPAEGKRDLLALDFAGNVKTFGAVHRPHFDGSGQPFGGVAPWHACKACGTLNHYSEIVCTNCNNPMPVRRAVTAKELEFGQINWNVERPAVQAIINKAGWNRHSVESLALHAYRKRSDPTSVSCMISIGLGGDAIVRSWFKRLKGPRWQKFWSMLLGESPAPTTVGEAYARRHELIRPAFVDIDSDGDFWIVDGVDYGGDEDEVVAAMATAAE